MEESPFAMEIFIEAGFVCFMCRHTSMSVVYFKARLISPQDGFEPYKLGWRSTSTEVVKSPESLLCVS